MSRALDGTPELTNARADYYERISEYSMAPLWEVLHQLLAKEPVTEATPHVWYYESIRQCAACYRMDERTVPPNKWKQDLRLTNDKTQSLERAREVFPSFELRLGPSLGAPPGLR